MLTKGIIRESNSPWVMPILLVPKKLDNSEQKKFRLFVDLRKLNDLIVHDSYPSPLVTKF